MILGFWPVFGVSGIVFGVSGLIFWVSGLIFWVSELILRVFEWGRVEWVGSGRSGGSGGRPGRVSSTFGEKSILGICIRKKVSIVYIFGFWTWGIFTKKTRAEKCCIFVCRTLSDLSYEIDLGPKTKTDYLSRKSVQFLKRFLVIWVVSQFIFWKGSLLYES